MTKVYIIWLKRYRDKKIWVFDKDSIPVYRATAIKHISQIKSSYQEEKATSQFNENMYNVKKQQRENKNWNKWICKFRGIFRDLSRGPHPPPPPKCASRVLLLKPRKINRVKDSFKKRVFKFIKIKSWSSQQLSWLGKLWSDKSLNLY